MGLLLRLLVAAGLAVDAYIHLKLAPDFGGDHINGGDMFYAQGGAAAVVAVLILAWPRRWSYAVAFLTAASAAGAVLLYYYVDVGDLGPLPNMHEHAWYMDKTVSLIGEVVAAVAAAVGALVTRPGQGASYAPQRNVASY